MNQKVTNSFQIVAYRKSIEIPIISWLHSYFSKLNATLVILAVY